MVLLSELHGTAIQREMVPFVPHLLLYGLKTLCGIEGMHVLLALLFSDEALMQPMGFDRRVPEFRLELLDLTHQRALAVLDSTKDLGVATIAIDRDVTHPSSHVLSNTF